VVAATLAWMYLYPTTQGPGVVTFRLV
jgi:hypothetical protein